MVEALTSKVTAWEKEKGSQFLYDGVSIYMLDFQCHYNVMHLWVFIPGVYFNLYMDGIIHLGTTSFYAWSLQQLTARERAREAKREGMDTFSSHFTRFKFLIGRMLKLWQISGPEETSGSNYGRAGSPLRVKAQSIKKWKKGFQTFNRSSHEQQETLDRWSNASELETWKGSPSCALYQERKWFESEKQIELQSVWRYWSALFWYIFLFSLLYLLVIWAVCLHLFS